MKYKDIFIDFDDTIYDTRGNAIISLRELYEWAELDRYFEDADVFYTAYWEANVDLWRQYSHGEIEKSFLVIERFKRPLLKGKGLDVTDDYCKRMSDKFLERCSIKPGVIDGAHEMLAYLKSKGYRLHICSNGFCSIQYKKLDVSDTHKYFDSVILSEDAGVNKPAKGFFDYALEKTGACRETTIMIGDNYDSDICGARNAGLATMLFNRWDKSFRPTEHVDYIVDELREIMNIL